MRTGCRLIESGFGAGPGREVTRIASRARAWSRADADRKPT
ncbi:hypothetical protein [Lentzea flaviverrucosa]|nr:hypothetical protein [Lentzea flaviverrucosa]